MGLLKKEQALPEDTFTRRQLLEDLHLTKNAPDTAYANFEAVIKPDLIDCYTYETPIKPRAKIPIFLKNIPFKDFQLPFRGHAASPAYL